MISDGSAHSTVIPGLVPGTHRSAYSADRWRPHTGQRRIEVIPMRVLSLDQIDLPRAWPFLHGFLALDSLSHVAEFLEPHEPVHLVFAREAGPFSGAVLFHSENDAVGDAGVEGSSRFAGEDVDPVTAHGASRNWR